MSQPQNNNSKTFVLVHGAFHGGWCWSLVANILRAAGHTVLTPTMTGLGERSHLLTPEVNLSTHIQDIVNVMAWENLRDVVLVGHSYGGAVITGVADRVADRIGSIVYLDAVIPKNGQSTLDVQPPERRQWMIDKAASGNGWTQPANSAEFYGVTDKADQAWVDSKCTPQPFATITQKLSLTAAPAAQIAKRLYILCTNPPLPYMLQFYDEAMADKGWIALEMETGHDAMVTEPKALSRILLEQA
jgi:pimeloyl-ACP methyl ester carboxylesterase